MIDLNNSMLKLIDTLQETTTVLTTAVRIVSQNSIKNDIEMLNLIESITDRLLVLETKFDTLKTEYDNLFTERDEN